MRSKQTVGVRVVDKASSYINILFAECVLQCPARGGDGSGGSLR